MKNSFENLLFETCSEALQMDFEKYENIDPNSFSLQSLAAVEKNLLAEKILLLPKDYINLLFFRYCFNFEPIDIQKILGVKNPKGELLYIKIFLSQLMNLSKTVLIDDFTIKRAAQLALSKYIFFDKKECKIPTKAKKVNRGKTAAIILLACMIGFSATIISNASFRDKLFNWFIEILPEYSIFTLKTTKEKNEQLSTLSDTEVMYIPSGFTLSKCSELKTMFSCEYSNNEGQIITLNIVISSGTSYKDTQNCKINTIVFKQNEAFWWQKNEYTYFVWQQNNYQCSIIAEISIEEVIKMAENVKI